MDWTEFFMRRISVERSLVCFSGFCVAVVYITYPTSRFSILEFDVSFVLILSDLLIMTWIKMLSKCLLIFCPPVQCRMQILRQFPRRTHAFLVNSMEDIDFVLFDLI